MWSWTMRQPAAVRRKILAAASTTLREKGVRGLSIAAVLERAALGTRAFYRHFDSKDQLVAALLLEMAHTEEQRLRRRMAFATTEIDKVAAWIDGRFDLAFDDKIKSDLRRVSLEAQSQMFASPNLVMPAYAGSQKYVVTPHSAAARSEPGWRSGYRQDVRQFRVWKDGCWKQRGVAQVGGSAFRT